MSKPDYLTRLEIADLMGITLKQFYNLCKSKSFKLPAPVANEARRLYYEKAEIIAWLKLGKKVVNEKSAHPVSFHAFNTGKFDREEKQKSYEFARYVSHKRKSKSLETVSINIKNNPYLQI